MVSLGPEFGYHEHSYMQANLKGADFSHRDLRGADFSQANLKGANFRGSDLRGAVFLQANLKGADLRDTLIEGAVFTQANTRGVRWPSKAPSKPSKEQKKEEPTKVSPKTVEKPCALCGDPTLTTHMRSGLCKYCFELSDQLDKAKPLPLDEFKRRKRLLVILYACWAFTIGVIAVGCIINFLFF